MAERPATHYQVRATRDRVIDLLGLGETHPLQDPKVDDSQLTVAFGEPAQIPVDPGQSDADYLLHHRGEPAEPAVAGTGVQIRVTSPSIVEDVTYQILARKLDPGSRSGRRREAWLHEMATVKVGLDRSLPARILAPLLDIQVEPITDDLPRLVDHGATIEVEIDGAQEGVDYQLVELDDGGEVVAVWSTAEVRGLGPGRSIRLRSKPLREDTVLRVHATKTFASDGSVETRAALLDAVLPLAVRADPRAPVSASPPVIGFGADGAVTVAGSQASAAYRLLVRTLVDADLVWAGAAEEAFAVPVPGQPDLHVKAPPQLGASPAGWTAGDWTPGNGAELPLPAGAHEDDALVIVQARKAHWEAGTTVVQLASAAAILVGPDPAVELALAIPVSARTMSGEVGLTGGDPGIFYTLRRGERGAERPPPAYFHQLDPTDPTRNRGIERLRVEGDLALARDPRPPGLAAEVRPLPPRLEIGSLPLDIELHVRARKARTRVEVELDRAAAVPSLPEILLEHDVVVAGREAHFRIPASRAGERYALHHALDQVGGSVGKPRDGDGGELLFPTGPLATDTAFELHITQPKDPGLPVTRIVRATVEIGLETARRARIRAPALDPAAVDDTAARIVDHGQAVEVEIDDAQPEAVYRLVEAGEDGEKVLSVADVRGLGPGSTTVLRTVPLREDTRIRIRATRTYDAAEERPTLTALLDAELRLAVRADPSLAVKALAPVIDFRADGAITVAESQASVSYQLFARPLVDADLVYDASADGVLRVAVEGEPTVGVRDLSAEFPRGFSSLNDWTPGKGGALRLAAPFTDDAVVIVRARKTHWDAGTSELRLEQSAVILAAPDPAVDLALEVPVSARTVSGEVRVTGGTPGVFYTFRRGATGADRLPPAYFHQLDPANPVENKGVDQLRVEGDLALARDPRPEGPASEARPLPPLLELGDLPLDIELHVRARKARTRVGVKLERTASLPAPPEIRLEQESVAAGQEARILVVASRVGERYEPFEGGVSVKRARNGNGEDLVFLTDPVTEATTFEVHVTRLEDPGLEVTRIVRLTVEVPT